MRQASISRYWIDRIPRYVLSRYGIARILFLSSTAQTRLREVAPLNNVDFFKELVLWHDKFCGMSANVCRQIEIGSRSLRLAWLERSAD